VIECHVTLAIPPLGRSSIGVSSF